MRTKSKPVEKRSRSANYQHRNKARGLCAKCPNPTGLNPHTGRQYHYCPAHRAKAAALSKIKMRRRRAR
jgi:hypothetical protein